MEQKFQEGGALVLTSQEPGAFLNFESDNLNDSKFIIPEQLDISAGLLFINGLDISKEASIYDDTSLGFYVKIVTVDEVNRASLFLYTTSLEDFSVDLKIKSYDSSNNIGGAADDTYDTKVLNRPSVISPEDINIFNTSNVQIDGESSYLVLRSNPKFSGNIKIAVDSCDNLYLDTFKVSDNLSKKAYRKQQVSSNGNFSSDFRTIFSKFPEGEIYKVGSGDTRKINLPKTDLFEQYETEYSYGARLSIDDLYNEEFSMLAPLWLNKKIPDYFSIFRLPGVYNKETYNDNIDIDLLATRFLEQGELVSSWGMKEKTPLGTYLRNHLSMINENVAPTFLSLSDPSSSSWDPNTWYGVDKSGVISGKDEVPTGSFDNISDNFTYLNNFVSNGFERTNLLCPNLLNLDFKFNDPDVSLYTMQRYFGLYLTENPLYTLAYYANDPDSSVQILSIDGNNPQGFFESAFFDGSGNISENYKNRILTLDDLLSIKRVNNKEQINGENKELLNEWVNKEGDSIFNVEYNKINNIGQFITLKIKNLLNPGETLRFVDKSSFTIWEINGVNDEVLKAGTALSYATKYESDGYPIVYRTSFSVKGDLSDQNNAIWNAWDVFKDYDNTPFKHYIKKEVSQSIKIKDDYLNSELKFQRITSQTTDIQDIDSSTFNNSADFDDIIFYQTLEPSIEDFSLISYDASYGPINFELYGNRLSLFVDIINPTEPHIYSLDSSVAIKFETNMLYMSFTDKWNRLIQYIDVSTKINHKLRYIGDPTSLYNDILLFTEHPIFNVNKTWNAYSVYPITISLMGINTVKDFDFTIYDASLGFKSDYWYTRENDVCTNNFYAEPSGNNVLDIRDSYIVLEGNGQIKINNELKTYGANFKFNTFDGSALFTPTSKTVVSRSDISGVNEFKSYNPSTSEEYICDYYADRCNSSEGLLGAKELKYSLTIPTITKWVGVGNDCRSNPFRLILNKDIFADVSTNFIPTSDAFKGELFYPSFKYLSPGERNWKDYIFFDVNDPLLYNDGGGDKYTSLKDLILKKPNIDVFSKLIYSNYKVKGISNRSSIVYYNSYKETLDFILSGLNLSIKVNDVAKSVLDIKSWDRYKISIIASSSRNKDSNKPMEFILNEINETILIIWYQGNDTLNYNYRKADIQKGKNLLDPSDSSVSLLEWRGFNDSSIYNYVKTPYGVNTATLSANIFNIYGIDPTYEDSTANQFNQINLNYGDDVFSVFNAYRDNSIDGITFDFKEKSFNSFNQYIDYAYDKSSASFGEGIVNLSYTYNVGTNLYKDQTCDVGVFKYLIERNNIAYYVLGKDGNFQSNNFLEAPISIYINEPREYRGITTYNGWYKPNFNNILEFSVNEDKELIDITNLDFVSSNTNLTSYNNIKQLWFNKVVMQTSEYDSLNANAIDYKKDFNPFGSQWDKGYYCTYDSSVKSQVNGYESALEVPSFFGSKLIKMPKVLEINQWNNLTASASFVAQNRNSFSLNSGDETISNIIGDITLTFNLSKSIVNLFKSNSVFINNWGDLSQSDNVINEYIKKTILEYYKLSQDNIKLIIWVKHNNEKNKNNRIAFELDDTFEELKGSNIDGELKFIDNEYIYVINVEKYPNVQYFVEFILFEK